MRLKDAGGILLESNKDDFYSTLMGEIEVVNESQANYYKANKADGSIMQMSLAQLITSKLRTSDKAPTAEVQSEIKQLRTTLKLPEPTYYAICFRALSLDAQKAGDNKTAEEKWSKVQKLIEEKNPSVPYLTMGELLLEAGKKNLAVSAIRKEKRYELKL